MISGRYNKSSIFLAVMGFILLLPLIATLLNSFASDWSGTVLPQGWTLDTYAGVLSDPRFHAAMLRSIAVAVIALSIATVVIVPAVVIGHIYWPALDRWMARLVVLPYAIPGIVLVVGYLRVFSGPPIQISGTPAVLVLTYIPLCFPLFYISLKNSLSSLDTRELLEAGRILGVSDNAILRRVIIPCIMPGVMLGLILNFAGLLGEFVYAKMLVGGNFETLQMYMFAQRNLSGRLSSVVVMIYFLVILVITLVSLRLIKTSEVR